jgi:hypothetical protein
MAITATTLSGAVTQSQTTLPVASATGITAPNWQTATGLTYLFVDQELMLVTGVVGTTISVVRGFNGTAAQAHVTGSQVQIGLPTDFPSQTELYPNLLAKTLIVAAMNQPAIFLAGTADAIPSTVPGFYVVKTAAADLMTLAAPTAAAEGNIVQIWSDTNFAHTLTATALLAGGTALKTTATFPAFRGAGIVLRACNLVWHVLSSGNGNVSSFVVLT